MDNQDVVIYAPVPGVCKVCAMRHEPQDPHDPRSLYWRVRFHRENGRYPTWEDAMAHCSEITRAVWVERLAGRQSRINDRLDSAGREGADD